MHSSTKNARECLLLSFIVLKFVGSRLQDDVDDEADVCYNTSLSHMWMDHRLSRNMKPRFCYQLSACSTLTHSCENSCVTNHKWLQQSPHACYYRRRVHSKNRLVETTKKLVDMCVTKLLVQITNPSLVKFRTNHK